MKGRSSTVQSVLDLIVGRGGRKPLGTHSSCTEHKQNIQSRLEKARQSGQTLLGLELPRCDADGTFSAYQCDGSRCGCVTASGKSLKRYSVARWLTGNMDCKCARAQDAYIEAGFVGKQFRCASNGNFESKQCMGSVCYCVDSDGRRVDENTVHIGSEAFANMTC
ncbi:hypothetical protein ScPMuIL_012290 [Solemya velum]